jgi:hypothetical protein
MKMIPGTNFDTQRNARWVNIGTATRYFTGKGTNTLGDIINSFETQLNTMSATYFTEVQTAMKNANVTKAGETYGRLVTYMITIPKEWESFKFDGAATAAATETIFKRQKAAEKAAEDAAKKKKAEAKPGQPLDTHVSVPAGIRITEVLDILLGQVKDIAELGAGLKTDKSVTFYKHFVGITSNDQYVTIHVDVVPFEVPNITPQQKQSATSSNYSKNFRQLEDGSIVPKNYAEFDYVFTGNNKDILNFDVKFQDITFLLRSDLDIGPGVIDNMNEKEAEKKGGGQQANDKAELVKLRPFDPILIPKNTADELSNFKKYTSLTSTEREKRDVSVSQKYMQNLSRFYTQQAFEAQLTIRGNPDIMAKFCSRSFQQHVTAVTLAPTASQTQSRIDTSVKGVYRENFEKSILQNNQHTNTDGVVVQEIVKEGAKFKVANTLGNDHFSVMPVYIKVNVNGPKIDFRTGSQKIGGEFAELLFQNNFFLVARVMNIIDGHKFTQELHLFSAGTPTAKQFTKEPKKV